MSEVAGLCEGDVTELVKEFAELCILVEPGWDERDIAQKRKEEHLRRLTGGETVDRMGLAISDACNFGCSHCIHFQSDANQGEKLAIYQKPIKQLNMSWETAKRCIDAYVALMREKGQREGKIHFGNAEPLLNYCVLEQVLHYCSEISGIRLQFSINTNLSLLTEKMARTFKQFGVRIATSLDGGQTSNDAIRITAGGRGTFTSILGKFDLLESI